MPETRLKFSDYFSIAWPLALLLVAIVLIYKQNHGGLAISRAMDAAAQNQLHSGSVAGFQITSAKGVLGPLTPKGGGVLMLASTTCGHCTASLAKFATLAGPSKSLPKMRLVVFQSAAEGVRLLAQSQLNVEVVGPSANPNELLQAFQTAGTPTFLFVDAKGNILDRYIGEPDGAALDLWLQRAKGV